MTSKEKALFIAECAIDRKAEDTLIIDVKKNSGIADFLIICSASSERSVRAIADNVVKRTKEKKINVLDVGGLARNVWILIDLGDVIAHVFHREKREFYNLEGLFSDSPILPVKSEPLPPTPQ